MTIYIYTGEGAGKTANALGLALRCIGHKQKVVIIQFLKWWKNTGEFKFARFDCIKKYYSIYQFGRKGWVGLGNLTEKDKQLARKALDFARQIVKKQKPRLLVLDEINLALHCKLLSINEVIQFLQEIPKNIAVVLTGRYAPRKLYEIADYVDEIIVRKMPNQLVAEKGIQY